ncbi:MFS general substrate transporter [Rhizoclosmatium globosum]|uniref:MFS general substrate transporter n=1 Tax=Rhizoclosmatium globosum TaxID=329046 RepID=A0A1Y2C4V1_9FUNG|nr:MFS general substrate transporter [Rhizoclosmatium globosum]|eukprot:ORY42058.1 MFS general substrate transporter [Rhizoclosmatium globosum]
MLVLVRRFRDAIGGTGSRLDIVLFGGFIGSLFSFLQFVSDKYGRKNILLLSMIGNAASMCLWIFSKSFFIFVLSRVVGGLTEGNVQMSIAMISDITTPETRSKGLALVGIAFSLGFTVGPPIGAYFASIDLLERFPFLKPYGVNSYSSPAIFALALIVIETAYMAAFLPETLGFKKATTSTPEATTTTTPKPPKTTSDATATATPSQTEKQAEKTLSLLSLFHFLFLFFFSGMEFTLTFLTYDRFHFTNAQQGKYLAVLGIVSALVQGGYVRRFAHKVVTEKSIVIQGMASCSVGLFIIGNMAVGSGGESWLYFGAVFLAFTSGTVVTTLTSLASLTISGTVINEHDESPKGISSSQGMILGKFRSAGQLGRSMGPLAACSWYWIYGSSISYSIGSFAIGALAILMYVVVPNGVVKGKKKVE